ncbi:hypothetical protein H4582DRAFT_1819741 [Lactarius indigo]|nr:hypothetical protein H4582DRAFT_1819741 [Lactarius indigo]
MSHTRGEYTFLPQDEDEDHPILTEPSPQGRGQCDSAAHDPAPKPANRPHGDGVRALSVSFSQRLIRWSLLFIVTCTVIDAMALAYIGLLSAKNALYPQSGDCAAAALEEEPLELRSSYINFDRIYGEGSTLRPAPHAPIVNHVLALAHVSRARSHAVVTRNPGGGMTINGYVPLDARRLWVSTIVQFRAIDYGMENCSLALAPPPAAAEGATPVDVELDVWALADAPRRPGRRLNANLDVRTLTWASRPERKERIGTLSVVGGVPGETRTFVCPSGSYHTLEIACATARGCDVDILGVGHGESGTLPLFSIHSSSSGHVLTPEPVWRFLLAGIYVKQYQTL